MNEKLVEETIEEKQMYEGKVFNIRLDTVKLPNGRIGTREIIEQPKSSGILAITDEGNILMIKQYRVSIKRNTFELPAGKAEKHENSKDAATRELEEETGFIAKEIEHYTDVYTDIGYVTTPISIFKATGLKKTRQKLDDDEFVEVHEVSPRELKKMLCGNQINDAKTVAVISKYLLENNL